MFKKRVVNKRIKTIVIILFILIVLFLALILFESINCSKENIVKLDSGIIKGKSNNNINIYLGIPYAKAPVGEFRWKATEAVEPWQGIKETTDYSYPCTQNLTSNPVDYELKNQTSEDCLYLNVWTPVKSPKEKLPVMVWIHGGAFTTGSGDGYDGTALAKKGVVIVTLNYRLGPFGFLSHPELRAENNNPSANYGLLDQLEAIKWVKANIEKFGGNPDDITIFGESAGSLSVSGHILSPLSKGLFKKAIMESGTIFTEQEVLPLANMSIEGADKTANEYAKRLGCIEEGKIISCLRQKSAEELENAVGLAVIFGPVYDNWFFSEKPEKILAEGKQNDVPIIIGFNADEGTIFTDDCKSNPELSYNGFIKPEIDFANSIKSPVYFYKFSRIPNTLFAKECGSFHSLELFYVFGDMNLTGGFDATDFKLAENIQNYWVNFAKTGNPNAAGLVEWPIYNFNSTRGIEFGDSVKINEDLFEGY